MKRMQEQIDHHKAQNIDIQDKLHRHSSNANVVSTVKVVAPKEDPNDNNKDNYKDTYKHKSDSENLNLMIQDWLQELVLLGSDKILPFLQQPAFQDSIYWMDKFQIPAYHLKQKGRSDGSKNKPITGNGDQPHNT